MATKAEMATEIIKLEANNPVANSKGSRHGDLVTELAAAKRRKLSKDRDDATSVVVKYSTESGENLSWKFFRQDTDEDVSGLEYGLDLPIKGSIVRLDDKPYTVAKVEDGLLVVAGDLPVRETFDARRIYTTPNGTRVCYKRTENNKIVLWSYKAAGEIMIGAQVRVDATENKAHPTARTPKRITQKVLAAFIISNNPLITPANLTKELQEAFPQAAVSARHGPHYLSLSRNGKLPEPPEDDPRDW